MTKLAEFLPVVFSAVEFSVPLIVPVGQEITALRAPEDTEELCSYEVIIAGISYSFHRKCYAILQFYDNKQGNTIRFSFLLE